MNLSGKSTVVDNEAANAAIYEDQKRVKKEVELDPDGDAQCPSCYHWNEKVARGEMNCFECHQPLIIA